MKGIRFYADLADENCPPFLRRATRKRLREYAINGGQLNCIAVLTGEEHRCYDGSQEALSATFFHPDSDTSLSSISRDYLRRCRHIDERTARKLHPRLAARLDS